jgi:single-strand DNA-binding protein
LINRAALTGRLTKDIELRYTQSGKAVGSFNLAVNRQFTNANNEREADFINCVIWGKSAENFASFTHKGALVGIEGRIQTRNYENNQGQKVYVTEVVVDNFALLEPKQNNGNGNQGGNRSNGNSYNGQNNGGYNNGNSGGYNSPPANNQSSNNEYNSQNNQNGADPFATSGDSIDISDDDLPF